MNSEPHQDVTIEAGCTGRGALSLGAGVYNYIVYGFGEEPIGYGTTEKDCGTAFTLAPKGHESYRSAFKTAGVYFVLGPNDGLAQIHPALTSILEPTACVPSQWKEMVTNASNCGSLNCR
jgi:hypothetical protein